MKKIFLLIFILTSPVLFNSCSDDDSPDKDKIIGQWEVFKIIANGITIPIEADDCDFKGALEFNSNGAFTAEDFEENLAGECFLDNLAEGTWVNKGNGIYEITVDGESELIEITFENDTFSITEEDGNLTLEVIYKRI